MPYETGRNVRLLARANTGDALPPGQGANVSLSRLILWLQEIDSEEDLFDHEGHAGVQVLTYHSAKGLEWPVCICCETTKPIKDRAWGLSVSKADEFSIQEPLAGRWIRFWPWPFGSLRKVDDVDLAGNKGVVELAKEADEEARRLLYVGLTRARDLPLSRPFPKRPRTAASWRALALARPPCSSQPSKARQA
jgi:ATP-dependent helicase/nuclease subunit A